MSKQLIERLQAKAHKIAKTESYCDPIVQLLIAAADALEASHAELAAAHAKIAELEDYAKFDAAMLARQCDLAREAEQRIAAGQDNIEMPASDVTAPVKLAPAAPTSKGTNALPPEPCHYELGNDGHMHQCETDRGYVLSLNHNDLRTAAEKLQRENAELNSQNEQLLTLSRQLDEHPDDYDGPCECKSCQSYMTDDEN